MAAAGLMGMACAGGHRSDSRAVTGNRQDAAGCRTAVASPAYLAEIAPARRLALRLRRELGAPGLAIAVSVRGNTVRSEVCGYADRASKRPVTRTTLFRIGIVSKTFTATAATRLVQAGSLDLDALIQRYVRSFPKKGSVVSARRPWRTPQASVTTKAPKH